MKLPWAAFIPILFLLVGSALGGDCPGASNDYFAPSGRMPKGKFVGNCLEVHKRSFRILSTDDAKHVVPDEIANSLGDRSTFIANISHDGDFWTAALPKEGGIESLTFLVERFEPRWLAAHTMIRVDFAEPVTLFSQTTPGKAPKKLKSLILSIEALAYQGGPSFGPISTLGQGFALATRIQSLEDRVAMAIKEEKNLVRQYRLGFSAAERDSFWWALLKRVHDPEMTQMYNLINRNCMNVLFQAIDQVLARARGVLSRIATFYPVTTRSALVNRGILDETKIPTLNEELTEAENTSKRAVCPMSLLPEAETVVRASQFGP